MTTALKPAPTRTGRGAPGIQHESCVCAPEIAFCSTPIANPSMTADAALQECIVCRDLSPKPCQRCGKR